MASFSTVSQNSNKKRKIRNEKLQSWNDLDGGSTHSSKVDGEESDKDDDDQNYEKNNDGSSSSQSSSY